MEPSSAANKQANRWTIIPVIGFCPFPGRALPEKYAYRNAIVRLITETPWMIRNGEEPRPANMYIDRRSVHYSDMTIYYNIAIDAELKSFSQLHALELYVAGLVTRLAEMAIDEVDKVIGYVEMASAVTIESCAKKILQRQG